MRPWGVAGPLPIPVVSRAHTGGRFPCFEGIRALAALAVIVFHCVFLTSFFHTPGDMFLSNLNSGVWVFFVASGFLLYGPFAAAHLAEGSNVDVRRYALRRAARLYPAYWLVLLFFTFVTGSRLEYYAFGSWPAVSLLIGLGLARAEERRDVWLPRSQTLLAIIGVIIAGVLGVLVWASSGIPATEDVSRLLATHPPDFYRVAMANFFDLTPQAFAALRVPAVSAALALSVGFSVAWWLRKQGSTWAPNVVAACAMLAFFHSANMAYATFEPRLSSRPLADELLKWLQPSDRLVIYGEFDAGSSLTFYTRRQAWIYNGRYNGLAYGSYLPDAPQIFLTDRDFPSVWDGPARVFMFVPPDQRQQALLRLPLDRAYFAAEKGGKALFVNRPLEPGQLSLEALVARSNPGARNQQRDHVVEWAVAAEQALSRGGAVR